MCKLSVQNGEWFFFKKGKRKIINLNNPVTIKTTLILHFEGIYKYGHVTIKKIVVISFCKILHSNNLFKWYFKIPRRNFTMALAGPRRGSIRSRMKHTVWPGPVLSARLLIGAQLGAAFHNWSPPWYGNFYPGYNN